MKNLLSLIPKSVFTLQCFALFVTLQHTKAVAGSNESVDANKYTFKNIGFVKNAGQVYDYDKNLVPRVLYSLNSDNSSIFLTTSGLTYSLIERDLQKANPVNNMDRSTPETKCTDKNVARLDMDLTGAHINRQNIVEMEYASDVPLSIYGTSLSPEAQQLKYCRQILIKNIYPQIDWVLKLTDENKFKYDFIVHPGGEVSDIKIKYNGSNSIVVNAEKKELTVATPLGNITEGSLFCYTEEERFPVKASYCLAGDAVNFNVSAYNKSRTLVIDPPIKMTLTWSTYYGGGSTYGGGGSVCTGIRCDELYNRVYVVGYCLSNPFPNYNNGVAYYFSPYLAGSSVDAFISAFDLSGAQLWASYYMSSDYDGAFDVTTDHLGNVYMVGITESHTPCAIGFLTVPLAGSAGGYCQSTNSGTYQKQDGFIVRFNSAGQLKWATLFGGSSTDQVYSVACDYNNNVFVAGLTWSQSMLPLLKQGAGYFQPTAGGAQSGIIAGFNVNTKLIWSTYFGNAGSDCRTITCDGYNNIYVTGSEGSSIGFPFSSLPNAYNNCSDGHYVAVFYSGSKEKWCSSFQPGQYIKDLRVNKADGTILIAGYSAATSAFSWQNESNSTPSTFFDNTFNGGDYDGFITLLNPDYSIRWSTLIGGMGNDRVISATMTPSGKIIVSGYTDNTGNPVSGNFPLANPGMPSYFQDQLKPFTPGQIFVAVFDSKNAADPHKLLWGTLFGDVTTGIEVAYDMDVCGKNLFITGHAFLEPAVPSFPLIHEQNGFLQTASNPIVNGFNASGSNGLIIKFNSSDGNNLRVGETNAENAIAGSTRLFPNPCSDNFIYLRNDNNACGDIQLRVSDACGRCVKQLNARAEAGQPLKIDLAGVDKGYYFLSVTGITAGEQLPFVKF